MIKQRIYPEPKRQVQTTLDYYRHVLSDHEAATFLQHLMNELQWQQESILIFGKEVLSPRLQCFYGDHAVSYRYSGKTFHAQQWPELLLVLKRKIESITHKRFNGVLCNLYRTGQDSMGWHSDDEKELGETPVIASFSLGETRTFAIRRKKATKQLFRLPLEHNSLLVMSEHCQKLYQHSVSKTKSSINPRINLTFRYFLD
jgi:alkylated DNA repair dioxygenase AlkB